MPDPRPFIPFRFKLSLYSAEESEVPNEVLCDGAFSEVTGLEATMKQRSIDEGGRNYGQIQRAGPTSFGTLTLKRGLTSVDHLETWFDVVARREAFGFRMTGRLELIDGERGGEDSVVLTWNIRNALPIKLKGPDLSATATAVAVEELQIVHEGLTIERGGAGGAAA